MKCKVLKKEKEFLKFTFACGINRFGDSIDALALTWLVYAISKSATYSAFNFGINYLPTILLTPFVGAFIEKRNKKQLMALSDFLRACLVLILLILYLSNHLNIYIIMLITFLISSLETLRVPASTPMIVSLISQEKYDMAQSFQTSFTKVLEILGAGIGGLLLNTGGLIMTFLIDICAFLLSSCLVYSIRTHEQHTIQKQSTFSLLKAGFHYTKTKPSLISLCLIVCCLNAFLVPINAFSSALSIEVYQSGPQLISMLNIGISIGSILGSLIYPYISPYFNARRMIQSLFIGEGLFYITSIGIAYLPIIFFQYLCFILISVIFGMIIVLTTMYNQIIVLKKVESQYLSRFTAIINALGVSAIPFISFFMSFISSLFSIQNIFIFTGIFVMIIGGIILYNSIDEVIEQDE